MPGFIVGLASCTQRSALETRLPFGHNSQGLSFRTDQQYSLVQMLYQKSEFVEKRVKHFLGRWACRMGGAPSPAFKTHVAWTPWCLQIWASQVAEW